MNFSSLDGRVRAVKLRVSLLEDGRPNLETIGTASGESRLSIIADREPVINDDVLEVAISKELDHEGTSLFPVVRISLIFVIGIFLANKELNSTLVSKHTES